MAKGQQEERKHIVPKVPNVSQRHGPEPGHRWTCSGGPEEAALHDAGLPVIGPSRQSIPVSGGKNRLLGARQSGFGTSAIYRITQLLQNISHLSLETVAAWRERQSPLQGEESRVLGQADGGQLFLLENRGPLVPESLSIRNTESTPMSTFRQVCSLHHRTVVRIAALYQ